MLRRLGFFVALSAAVAMAQTAGPAAWQNDLTPIGAADWNYDFAAHLLERAGFGGTPEEIDALAKMTPAQAIARMVRFEGTDSNQLPRYDESPIHDPGLEPFPPSRPAVTDMAKERGEVLDGPDVASLSFGPELADGHVFDHPLAQRAYGRVGHGGLLSWVRL